MYQIAYSLQDTSSQRDIDFLNTSAKADYKSHIATLDLRLLRDMQINSDTLLQPFVSTLYRHFKSPSYNEQGAGSLNFADVQFIILGHMLFVLYWRHLSQDQTVFIWLKKEFCNSVFNV